MKTDAKTEDLLAIEYRYFFLITNIDNQLTVTCGAEGNDITIFPAENENNYFDNDQPLNIVREFTGSLQPNISNKLSFKLFNGRPTPNNEANPVHLRYKIYYEKYNNGTFQERVDVVPFVNRYKDHQPANQLIWNDVYTIVKQKNGSGYSFSLDQ